MGIIWGHMGHMGIIWGLYGPYGVIWGHMDPYGDPYKFSMLCAAHTFFPGKNDTPRMFNCVFLLVFFMIWQFRDHMGLYGAI